MNRTRIFTLLAAATLSAATAQNIPTFAAADLVLGQPDFVSDTSGTSASQFVRPSSVAIDPATQKLFVSEFGSDRILRFRDVSSLANGDSAEAVFGQMDFTGNSGGTSQSRLDGPAGLHVDGQGRLWVADALNHRVLMFESASSRDSNPDADLVLGQLNFVSKVSGDSSNNMDVPIDVVIDDAADRLWVAEQYNNRVLRFDNVSLAGNGHPADAVLGQPDYGESAPALSQSGMDSPFAIELSPGGALFVAEVLNRRVLRYDAAATKPNGGDADAVLGQSNFGSNAFSTLTQVGMAGPAELHMDSTGTLWVADSANNRILSFVDAAQLPNGAPAASVLGQPDFTTNASGLTARNLDLPNGLVGDSLDRLYVTDSGNRRVLRFSPTIPAPTVVADTTRPTLRVRGRKTIESTRNRIVIRGTASDDTGIAEVEFKVSGQRGFQSAKKTTRWKAIVRPDKNKNKTVVRVRAIDASGNKSRFLKLKIFRR